MRKIKQAPKQPVRPAREPAKLTDTDLERVRGGLLGIDGTHN